MNFDSVTTRQMLSREAVRAVFKAILCLSILCSLHSLRADRPINTSLNLPLNAYDPDMPQWLSETGIFKDLATLEPEDGILPYAPAVNFWSDYAIKTRWVYIPEGETIGFAEDSNWDFPVGSIWVKHFDLELERGNPASRERIETRILVKNQWGVYGVSYHWNEEKTDAALVRDDFVQLQYDIIDGSGNPGQQDWTIPSSSDCDVCHTRDGGYALSFNTRQLNRDIEMDGEMVNLIAYLSDSGYLNTEVSSPHLLPYHSSMDDESVSLDHRARSYLAVNCSNCHQRGLLEAANWDARGRNTLEETLLVNDVLGADGSSVTTINRGNANNSSLWLRLTGADGFDRMPPLGSHELDLEGAELIKRWIEEYLPEYRRYREWQIENFEDVTSVDAAKESDPDRDGDSNYQEFLSRTDPNSDAERTQLEIETRNNGISVSFNGGKFAEYQLETSTDLESWEILNIPENIVRTVTDSSDQISFELDVTTDLPDSPYVRVRATER